MAEPHQAREHAATEDDDVIGRAAREGVRRALLRHKRLGESIVEFRDGQIVEVPPEQIDVDESPDEPRR